MPKKIRLWKEEKLEYMLKVQKLGQGQHDQVGGLSEAYSKAKLWTC